MRSQGNFMSPRRFTIMLLSVAITGVGLFWFLRYKLPEIQPLSASSVIWKDILKVPETLARCAKETGKKEVYLKVGNDWRLRNQSFGEFIKKETEKRGGYGSSEKINAQIHANFEVKATLGKQKDVATFCQSYAKAVQSGQYDLKQLPSIKTWLAKGK